MRTNRMVRMALVSAATALMLLSPTALAASTPLTMQAGGIIMNAGSQTYSFSGGSVVQGAVMGNFLNPGAKVNFHFGASVDGLATSGSGQITIPASSISGGHGAVVVKIQMFDQVPAAVFPINFDPANPAAATNCDPASQSCTSQIPILFEGLATVSNRGTSQTMPVVVESPYWNPFGGPIVIASVGTATGALFMDVTYNSANIDWSQVQLMGQIGGYYGTEAVGGNYMTVTNSHENLFAGTEQDSGQIIFAGMSDSKLNGQGSLQGSTTIPPIGTNSYDCTSDYAIAVGVTWPFGPGTCVLTGASSSGNIRMTTSSGVKITGTFETVWSVPSLTTMTGFSASAS